MRIHGGWDGTPANDNGRVGEARPAVVDVVLTFSVNARAARGGQSVVLVRAEGSVRRPGARGPAVRA